MTTQGASVRVTFTHGAFRIVEEPGLMEWWAAELDDIWGDDEGRSPAPATNQWRGGANGQQEVTQYRCRHGAGWIVLFGTEQDVHPVHCPTDADLLDLLTTRAPAWLSLGNGGK